MATPADKTKDATRGHTWRRYKDGDHTWRRMNDVIFIADATDKCPTYVHKNPALPGELPVGRGRPRLAEYRAWHREAAKDVAWQEYAFRRSTDANPFPSMMGRVCPAPCQTGCNRNVVEDTVGINAVEPECPSREIKHIQG